jgi:hypothetical protein
MSLLLLFNQAAASGGVTFNGQTLTTTTSLIKGAWSAGAGATFAGQTLTATTSLLQGSWAAGATFAGQTLTTTTSLIKGAWSVNAGATFAGQTLTVTTSLIRGAWSTRTLTDADIMAIWNYEIEPGITAGEMLNEVYQRNCWSELTASNNVTGTFGKLVQDAYKQTKLSVGLSA